MTDWYSCTNHRCRFDTAEALARCPQCGAAMWPAKAWRRRGWALVALGLVLAGLALAIAAWMVPLILAGPEGIGGARFASDDPAAVPVLGGILALLLAFGLACVLGGARQAITGRRSRALLRTLPVLFALLIAGAMLAQLLLGDGDPMRVPRMRLP